MTTAPGAWPAAENAAHDGGKPDRLSLSAFQAAGRRASEDGHGIALIMRQASRRSRRSRYAASLAMASRSALRADASGSWLTVASVLAWCACR